MKRQAYRAGTFYQSSPQACRSEAKGLLDHAALPATLPGVIYGGIVPHAGWTFSGRTAAMTIQALSRSGRLERLVIFGADHWGISNGAALYAKGTWESPLGEVAIDEELAAALLAGCPQLHHDDRAHAREHSIEVQLPLIQMLSPNVRIVPINLTPSDSAAGIGAAIGAVLASRFPAAGVLGSSDLTHYGPQYGFTPGGEGQRGLDWAVENDRRLLKLIERMRADQVVDESNARQNACGGGAIAAAIAACAAMGATRGVVLDYTTSAEVIRASEGLHTGQVEDAVGYASVVFA